MSENDFYLTISIYGMVFAGLIAILLLLFTIRAGILSVLEIRSTLTQDRLRLEQADREKRRTECACAGTGRTGCEAYTQPLSHPGVSQTGLGEE